MKKTVCAILVIAVFMSMVMGCKSNLALESDEVGVSEGDIVSTEIQNTEKRNYKQEYIEAVEKWIYFTGEANRSDYPGVADYIFLDLDFDGYPELIRSVRSGSGGNVSNEYYTYKPGSGIEKMNCSDNGCWDNNWTSLKYTGYIIKSGNGYSYILRNDSHAIGTDYIKVDYVDGELRWEEIGTSPIGDKELLPEYPFEIFGERKSSSEEVENAIKEKSVNCNILSYSAESFLWDSKRARTKLVEEAYDGYFVEEHTYLDAGKCEEPEYRKYITDHEESTIIKDGNFDVEYIFPRILVTGEYVDKCNAEIYEKAAKAIDEANGEYGPVCYIDYECWLNNDVLSVVFSECSLSGDYQYYVYNINIVTGEQVNDSEILGRVGMTIDEYNAGLDKAHREGTRVGWFIAGDTPLEKYIIEREEQDLLNEQLKKTLSPENMQQAQIFIGYDNELWLANKIYSNGGADYYERLFWYPVE